MEKRENIINVDETNEISNRCRKNLRYLQKQNNLTTSDMCAILGTNASGYSQYINGPTNIPVEKILILKKNFNFSLDDFYFHDFEEEEMKNPYLKKYNNYYGLFSLYYFDTVIDTGSSNIDMERIKYGLMLIYRDASLIDPIKVAAVFNLSYAELESSYKYLGCNFTDESIQQIAKDTSNGLFYQGTMEVIDRALNVYLKHLSKDSVFYSLQRPTGTSPYIGGLGLLTSLSRGSEVFGCSQYMGCCRGLLKIHETDLANYLEITGTQTEYPSSDCKKLLNRIDKYFNPTLEDDDLDEDEKRILIEHSIKKMVDSIVTKNSKRYLKVDPVKEKEWYQMCKKV